MLSHGRGHWFDPCSAHHQKPRGRRAAENYMVAFGDFSNYVIARRLGFTIELVPHLFATGANRPSGQRGLFGYARLGADSVNDGAFVLLNVT